MHDLIFSGSHIYGADRTDLQTRSCHSRFLDVDPDAGGPLRTPDDRGSILRGGRCRRWTLRPHERRTKHRHRVLQREESQAKVRGDQLRPIMVREKGYSPPIPICNISAVFETLLAKPCLHILAKILNYLSGVFVQTKR